MTAYYLKKVVGRVDKVLINGIEYTEADLKGLLKTIKARDEALKKLDEKMAELIYVKENAS